MFDMWKTGSLLKKDGGSPYGMTANMLDYYIMVSFNSICAIMFPFILMPLRNIPFS